MKNMSEVINAVAEGKMKVTDGIEELVKLGFNRADAEDMLSILETGGDVQIVD